MRDMPNLDLVRSMAVISVVLEHYLLDFGMARIGPFSTAWCGVFGVMLFYVLTCLVLMWSLDRRPHTLDFYIRRIFRLYPLAWLSLAVAWALHVPQIGAAAVPLREVLHQFTLLPPVGSPLVENVMWSLPYEVGMYLVLPALFFYIRKNYSLWPLLVLWILFLLVGRTIPSDFHNFDVAIGYFLPGVMSYVLFGKIRAMLPAWLMPVCLSVLWLTFWYRPNFHRCWFFCLGVGLMLPLFRQIQAAVVLAPSRIIARYSYGIYLSHPFALAFGIQIFRHHSARVQLLATIPLLILLPVAAYHFLEYPMIRLGSKLAQRAESRYEQSEMTTVRATQV